MVMKGGKAVGRFIILLYQGTELLLSTPKKIIAARKSFSNNIHYLTVINNKKKLVQQIGMVTYIMINPCSEITTIKNHAFEDRQRKCAQ